MKIIKNEYGAKAELKRKFYKAFCFITRKKLIIDVTGTILTPGNEGHGCRASVPLDLPRASFTNITAEPCR